MRKLIIIGSIAAVGVVALALVMVMSMTFIPQSLPQSAESKTVVTSINRQNETTVGNFEFHICGEETADPRNVPGEPEHPAQLSRSAGEKVTIPFCVTAVDKNSKVLLIGLQTRESGSIHLTALQDGSAQGKIANGIVASLDKTSLPINSMTTLATPIPGSNYHVADRFNVTLAVSPDAPLGRQMIGVSMLEPDETGVSGLKSTVFVYLEVQ